MNHPNHDETQECPELTLSITVESDMEFDDNENELVFQVICEGGEQYTVIKTELQSNKSTDNEMVEIKMEIEEQYQENVQIKEEFGCIVKDEPEDYKVEIKEEPQDSDGCENVEIKQENIETKEEPCESENVETKVEPCDLANVSSATCCNAANEQKEFLNNTDVNFNNNDCTEETTDVVLKKQAIEQMSTKTSNKKKYKPTYKCQHCKETFKDSALRKQHIRNHKLEIFNVREIEAVDAAAEGKIQQLQLKCIHCDKTWPRIRKNSMQKHALKHRPKKHVHAYYDGVWAPGREYTKYACPECNRTFVSQSKWNAHICSSHKCFDFDALNNEMSTPDGQRQCRECGKDVQATAAQMQRHKLLHLPHKSFICRICGERRHWFVDISQHIRKEHFTRGQFQCCACKKIFETHHLWWQHCRTVHNLNITQFCMKSEKPASREQLISENPNNLTDWNVVNVEESTISANNSNSNANRLTFRERIAIRRLALLKKNVNERNEACVIKPNKVSRTLLVWNWSDDVGATPANTLWCNNITKELEDKYKQRDIY